MRAIRVKSKMSPQELAVYCETLELKLVRYKKRNKQLIEELKAQQQFNAEIEKHLSLILEDSGGQKID